MLWCRVCCQCTLCVPFLLFRPKQDTDMPELRVIWGRLGSGIAIRRWSEGSVFQGLGRDGVLLQKNPQGLIRVEDLGSRVLGSSQ